MEGIRFGDLSRSWESAPFLTDLIALATMSCQKEIALSCAALTSDRFPSWAIARSTSALCCFAQLKKRDAAAAAGIGAGAAQIADGVGFGLRNVDACEQFT